MANPDVGTLYVLANRDSSLAKVGLTRDGSPETRADAYAREHGIQWRLYWSAVTCNIAQAEVAVHRELAEFRFSMVPGAREIFQVTPAKAKRVAERYLVAPKTDAQLAAERAEHKRRQREAEAAKTQREAEQRAEAAHVAQEEWERKTYWFEYRESFLGALILGVLSAVAIGSGLESAGANGHSADMVGFLAGAVATLTIANWMAKRRLQKRIQRNKNDHKATP